MAIGGYRFRRSFGNVKSRFRGARPDTYPLSNYVKDGLVLDLSKSFFAGSATADDLSPEGNDAILNSGRYVTTDGIADKAINADCSALGDGSWTLKGKVRAAGSWAVTMDGVTGTIVSNPSGLWKDFEITLTTTPSLIALGWTGSDLDGYFEADWSDVILVNATTGFTVARWQLNEHADLLATGLNGYPSLDSSGNGYNGSYVGCSGNTGEPEILQTAAMDWNRGGKILDAILNETRNSLFEDVADDWRGTSGGSSSLDTVNNRMTARSGIDDNGGAKLNSVDLDHTPVAGETYRFILDIETINLNGSNSWQVRCGGAANIASQITTAGVKDFLWTLPVDGRANGFLLRAGSVATLGRESEIVFNSIYIEQVYPNDHLIAASDTDPTVDAIGNAIQNPRPNSKTFNFFGDGEHALIPDSDSLDLTTEATWEIWGNFYGVPDSNEVLIAKYDTGGNQRSWYLRKSNALPATQCEFAISQDGLPPTNAQISGFEDKTQCLNLIKSGSVYLAYLDGSPVTISGATGLGNIYVSTAPVTIGQSLVSGSPESVSGYSIGAPKIYDRALTADEVLTNYNAQKAQHGL